jgi:hypothetical protein
MIIACWFSCGVASAVAAKLTLAKYPLEDVRIIYNPVKEEDADNLRFLMDCEAWFGRTVEIAKASKYPSGSAVEVWDRVKFMSGPHGAPCTRELKKVARQEWESRNRPDWHVLGFTADERDRHERFTSSERSNVIPILITEGLAKKQCYDIVRSAGIAVPRIYGMGYPNANCVGCVKATSATYWNLVREQHPDVFAARAEQSRRLGAKLVRHRGVRMFLDDLPPDAKGRSLKSMDIECGIFCEEKS